LKQYILGKNQPVTPEEVFTEVNERFKFYIEWPEEVIHDFLTLWVIGTYFHPLFNSYPYVYVGGIKRSGKTKVLTVAAQMSFNSIFSGNMSTASLYRLIQNNRCSLFIDETEKLSNPERMQDFRNILLSGYKKGEKAYRIGKTAKDRLIPEAFEVYGPKMLANIGGLEDVLSDRCIPP
jgi:hypothetical protein